MYPKYFRKNYVYILISLCIVMILTVYMMNLQKDSYSNLQTQVIEKFDATRKMNAFDIPKMKKWQFPNSIDTWYHITQGGYSIPFKELGFTMPNSKMTIMFLFNCQSREDYWRNIFHFTNSGKNCCDKGDRIPAMWVYPHYMTNYHVRFSTDTWGNDGDDINNEMDKSVPQLITLIFNDNKVVFYLNNVEKVNREHHNIYKRDDKTVLHIGDPWHWNNKLHIKNFTLYDGVLSDTEVKQVYNALTEDGSQFTF